MTKKQSKPTQSTSEPEAKGPVGSLDEAIEVKALVKRRLDSCDPADMAKYVDAYARAANVVRQFEKDHKRALASFTDDELIEYLRALPDRRRDVLVVAVQGTSLAGKPLF